MTTDSEWLSIQEALERLKMNGVEMNSGSIRMAIIRGTIKSEKQFSSRVIHRDEISRIIAEHRARRQVTGR